MRQGERKVKAKLTLMQWISVMKIQLINYNQTWEAHHSHKQDRIANRITIKWESNLLIKHHMKEFQAIRGQCQNKIFNLWIRSRSSNKTKLMFNLIR
jgi:hypothetical protein